MDIGKPGTGMSFFHFLKFVMNFFKRCCLNIVVGGYCTKSPNVALFFSQASERAGCLNPQI